MYEVVSHCHFYFHFLMIRDPIFMCLLVVFYISFLGKCLFKSLHNFDLGCFFLSLSFRRSLYILDINPLSDVFFADISSYSMHCLFTLLIMTIDKIFNFAEVKFVYFFVAYAFGVTSKKPLPYPTSCSFLVFVSISLMVLALMYRFLVPFEVTFAYDVR